MIVMAVACLFSTLTWAAGPISDWQPADPDQKSPSDDLSAESKFEFWQKGLAKLCEEIDLPLSGAFRAGVFRAGARYRRYLQSMPDSLYIIDRTNVNLTAERGINLGNFSSDHGFLNFNFSANYDGLSEVIRPIGDRHSCLQLPRLIDPTDFRAVIPVTSHRLSHMSKGEIWKLPVSFRLNINPAVGYVHGNFSAVITFLYYREGAASVTLHRLSEEELRMRMRFSHIRIQALGFNAQFRIDALRFGGEGQNELIQALGSKVGNYLFREVDRVLHSFLTLDHTQVRAGEMVTEFVANPNREDEIEALNDFLNGKIPMVGLFTRLTANAAREFAFKPDRQQAVETATEISEHLKLSPTFTGLMDTEDLTTTLRIQLPLFNFNWSKNHNRDSKFRVIRFTEQDADFRIHGAFWEHSSSALNLPVIGGLIKYKGQDSILTAGEVDERNPTRAPIAVYVQQEGFVRYGNDKIASMIQGANSIMKYVGVRGHGTNPRTVLPIELDLTDSKKMYTRGYSALSVVFTDAAMATIRAAAPDDVYRAYLNTLDENSGFRAQLTRILSAGWTKGDATSLGHRFDLSPFDQRYLAQELNSINDLIEDIARTGNDKNGEPLSTAEQALAWRNLLAAKAKSQIQHVTLMKVLVQLVNSNDLSAEYLFVLEDKDPNHPLRLRYLLNPDSSRVGQVQRINSVLSRFRSRDSLSD